MSDTDDYIKVKMKFEKVRQEYLEWVARTGHLRKLLRQIETLAPSTAPRRLLSAAQRTFRASQ